MDEQQSQSRRRLLTGGAAVVGSAAGAVLLGSTAAEAANGNALLAGKPNTATATTSLTNSSASGGAHGLIISAKGGYGFQASSAANHGVAGITAAKTKAGVIATHNGPAGTGAALVADGRKNVGATVKNDNAAQPALVVRARRSITGGTVEPTGAFIDVLSAVETDWPIGLKVVAWVITPEGHVHYGTAIEANGHVEVNGSLSKSSGSFKIDHPLDPANKYLYHSFVESPDMANIYQGEAKANAEGEAVVELPEYFEALNKDVRYQLTPLQAAAPDLHVKTLLRDGKFTIAGAKPNQTVCWQVTGTRKDAWANAHRVEVEQDKPAKERGTYLFPKGHGQPEEKRLGYTERPS